jgi:hypothetical protein
MIGKAGIVTRHERDGGRRGFALGVRHRNICSS